MDNTVLIQSLRQLAQELRSRIELSCNETSGLAWGDFLVKANDEIPCWERKKCAHAECPVYNKKNLRCWLVAGTLCGGKTQGVFAAKYKSCFECEVYQESVFQDPVSEIREHVVALMHSLYLTHHKLEALALRDPLTGIYNRTYFNEIIDNEIHRTERYGNAFSLIMLDLDNFKSINDTYGHLEGDRMLKECAAMLSRCVRSSDLLVRFGGDEFLILTSRTGPQTYETLQARINRETALLNSSRKSACRLSVSMGCAVFRGGGTLLEVLKKADAQMYAHKARKKQEGRLISVPTAASGAALDFVDGTYSPDPDKPEQELSRLGLLLD